MCSYKVNNIKISCRILGENITNRLKDFSQNSNLVSTKLGNFFVLRQKFVFIIFYSGHVNCTKIKSMTQIPEVMQKLNELFPDLQVNYTQTDNISASGVLLNSKINLFELSQHFKDNSQAHHFNPQLFPGLYTKYNSATFIIFKTGKFVCVGTKSISELEQVCEKFEENINKFLRNHECL